MAHPDGRSQAHGNSDLEDARARRQAFQRGLQLYRGVTKARMVASSLTRRTLQSVHLHQLPEGERRERIDYSRVLRDLALTGCI